MNFAIDDQTATIYVSDNVNTLISEWENGVRTKVVPFDENGFENNGNQLKYPSSIVIDRETNSLIVCFTADNTIGRISRRMDSNYVEILIADIFCSGMSFDQQGNFYAVDFEKNLVRKYSNRFRTMEIVVGGHGRGRALNQLDTAQFLTVDHFGNIFIADNENRRIVKWVPGAENGTLIFQIESENDESTNPFEIRGILVDSHGTIYFIDGTNSRIFRLHENEKIPQIIFNDDKGNFLTSEVGISDFRFDRNGNLYLANGKTQTIYRFDIVKNDFQ